MATKKSEKPNGQQSQSTEIADHPWQAFVMKRVLRSALKNAPYNPRKISDKARKRLAQGMEQLKLLGPIIWNELTGNIVGGHQRIDILDKHADGAPDYYLNVAAVSLSNEDEIAANLLLNNAEAQGDWDLEKLSEMFKTEGLKIEATGFGADDMYNLLGDDVFTESTAPELEKLADKLRSEREKHANIVKGNERRDNSEFYIVIVFRSDVECGEFITRHGLDNRTYQSFERFEKLMLPPKESTDAEFGELPSPE